MNCKNQQTSRSPLWDELVLLPAQLSRPPLFSAAEAELSVSLGKSALIPLRLELPLIVSHMSAAAVSCELKSVLARAAAAAGIAAGSGEGGVFREEMELSSGYIFEYTPGLYGLTPEVLERCGGVEIKIGRSLRGGLGEALPAGLEPEIYHMRNTEPGGYFTAPGRFAEINSPSDLRIAVEGLREGSGGKPVGVKLATGNIEADIDFVIESGADFVTLDGGSSDRGGVLDSSCVPLLYAICRAKKIIDSRGAELDIVAVGGLRTSADMAKALALGATAVASATAVLEAARADENGTLTLSPEETLAALTSFFRSVRNDLSKVCAFTGRRTVGELCEEDIASLSYDISRYAGIRHV